MSFIDGLLDGLGLGTKDQAQRSVQDCISMVEHFLEQCGVNAENALLDTENCVAWLIRKGSASIYIVLAHNELMDEITLEAFSPILKLPQNNILPFYRRCLEMNRYLAGSALSVEKDTVMLVSERSIEGLGYEELVSLIGNVADFADRLDDDLAEEFGATLMDEA